MMENSKLKRGRRVYFFLFFSLMFACNVLGAKEVSIEHNGLILNADWQGPKSNSTNQPVVVLLHGGLAHKDMEIIDYLQSLLAEQGFQTLAITLSLGVSNRKGMFDCSQVHNHFQDNALVEIHAWMNWLHREGYRHTVLLGHSRGGLQAAWYAGREPHPILKSLVLMAPATTENGHLGYENRFAQALKPILLRAKKLLKSDSKNAYLHKVNMMFCRNVTVTASSFLSYYDNVPGSVSLLKSVNLPTLVLVAAEDAVVKNLEEKLVPLDSKSNLKISVIDGAGHFFRDLFSDEAVDAIQTFLRN